MSEQKKSIELSLEETKEIEQMMESNKLNSEVQNNEEPEDIKIAKKEMKKAFQEMKKILKLRSKGELIELVWTYGVQLQEMQRVAQQLFEENQKLKESQNDK